MVVPVGVLALLAFFFFLAGVRVVKEFERGVILRLGRYVETKQPGFKWLIPGVDKMYTVDTRIVARDVPPQDVITKDNVSVKVNAVIYFRVVDPDKAILKVENYLYATSQYAQTTLRSILGQHELDDILAERERINHSLQTVLDRHDLPQEMQRAMAKQAEAERERRAKVIAAGGEVQASKQLAEAATTIATAPGAMTLRYLQTLAEIAIENNSTIAFPIPVDLLAAIRGYVDAMPVGARGPVEPPVPMPIGRSAPVVGASQPGPVPTAAPREPSGRTLPQPPAGSSPFGGGDSGA